MQHEENTSLVECAIARAGAEVMLCIEWRHGRTPIREIKTHQGTISWVCADGTEESPYLSGESAQDDMNDLIKEVASGGLLVSEFKEDAEPAHWLMERH